jgi:hypothetical protein
MSRGDSERTPGQANTEGKHVRTHRRHTDARADLRRSSRISLEGPEPPWARGTPRHSTNEEVSHGPVGAGAGRLAYDLHARKTGDVTVALDFNPLSAIVAVTVARGDTIELYGRVSFNPSTTMGTLVDGDHVREGAVVLGAYGDP